MKKTKKQTVSGVKGFLLRQAQSCFMLMRWETQTDALFSKSLLSHECSAALSISTPTKPPSRPSKIPTATWAQRHRFYLLSSMLFMFMFTGNSLPLSAPCLMYRFTVLQSNHLSPWFSIEESWIVLKTQTNLADVGGFLCCCFFIFYFHVFSFASFSHCLHMLEN